MIGKTTAVKSENLNPKWHFIDAEGQILGRLATEVAKILTGKNKATFSRTMNVGDKVVITNASKIAVTGKKLEDKKYQWYTGFPSGLREEALQDRLERSPIKVIEGAVRGMLPKNRLQRERMTNLHVYAGPEHPHAAQQKNLEKK
jgi:large subunit ribosomal protein L13